MILDWVPAHFPRDDWALATFDGNASLRARRPAPRRASRLGHARLQPRAATEVRNFLLANALYWLKRAPRRRAARRRRRVDALPRLLAQGRRVGAERVRRPRESRRGRVPQGAERDALRARARRDHARPRSRPRGPASRGRRTSAASASASSGTWAGCTTRSTYFQKDPVYRRFHHHTLTFSLMYAFSENFVLPLSHDEVVHGKRSLLDKMPGDRWQKFANLRALYAYMWAHPGKKLLFMGGELGEWEEWNDDGSLHWNLLEYAEHEGVQSLVRDLNRAYRATPALWERRLRPGRLPLARGERRREQRRSRSRGSARATRRRSSASSTSRRCRATTTASACRCAGRWREVLNTDSAFYGGSGVGNLGGVEAEAMPWHDQPFSATADAAAARRGLARPGVVLLSLPNVGRPSDSCAVLSQPVGTVTLLFTDVEGSTRLLERLGAADDARVLEQHRALLRDSFAKHEGYEFGTEGDASSSPSRRLAGPSPRPVKRRRHLRTRVAGRRGAASADGRAHRQPDAGRLELRRHRPPPSRTDHVRRPRRPDRRLGDYACPVDAKLTELGEHRLKDFDEPIALFQIDDDRFPPLKTISNTNLRRPASSLVGRERERDELVAMLQNGSRSVTLTGPGGSGKTRLALEVASDLVPAFGAGVFWSDLSPLRDPGLVTETLARTLGAKTDLAEHISDRDLLLVLDNFEQVADAAPELGRLLEACPRLRAMITSRELPADRRRGRVPGIAAGGRRRRRALLRGGRACEPDGGDRRALPATRQHASRRRVGRRSHPGADARPDPGANSQRLDLLKGGRDADPCQQTCAPRSSGATTCSTRKSGSVRALAVFVRRLHPRTRRRSRRSRPRHPPVARRQKPAAPHRRPLLDAGDDPRLRARTPRRR